MRPQSDTPWAFSSAAIGQPPSLPLGNVAIQHHGAGLSLHPSAGASAYLLKSSMQEQICGELMQVNAGPPS
ncbi:hypothetical protein ACN3VN_03170 [Xylella fastidiosa]|uniref:hypothetical protein n=1 Tax=Xylella fastidiosa TaxID=2371 RepID=UPI000B1814B6|nr:hypothetical protein [Xylella fastidiosa]